MDGIQIELATLDAATQAYTTLAQTLLGQVPDPEQDTTAAFMIWTQLEAACGLAATQALTAVPAHQIDWDRIALVLGTTPADAKTQWEPPNGTNQRN